ESGADSVTEFNIITPAVCGGEENEEEDGGQSASVREREAAWIARRVAKMVADGEKIYDRALGGCRPVTYGDFAVLVRSAKRRVSVIADAFSELGIPVNTDAGGDIFSTAEVNAVMSMLSAVDNPGRDLALAGYLRSPLECFSADDLGRVKMAGGGAGFYAAMKLCAEGTDETSEKCRNALARLEKMRLAASELDVGRAVGLLLDMSGAFVVFGAMDGGVTRRANLNLLIGLASAYGERGGQDLGGFVKSLERSRDHGDEFPAPKAGADGVRVMTVHASKGLEFPVVFLANTMEKLNTGWKRENVLVHSDCGVGMMYSEPGGFTRRTTLPREAAAVRISAQQIAEELRLLYVAMTRAREKLIVTGYCENLSRVRAEVESNGSRSWIGGVCSRKASFGRWLLAAVCADGKIPVDFNIYGDESAETAVPSENPDVRQEADAALVEEISRRVNFVYPYINAAGMPAKMTATGYNGLVELAGESLKTQREIALPEFMDKRGDLSAAERGVAVHLAMQLLPGRKYATEDDADAEIGKLVSRGVLSSRQRTVISGRGVKAFYDSAIGGRVLDEGNTSVRREFKFSLLCPAERFAGADAAGEQLLLQGVIDLFWVSGEGYAEIADYKTDNIRPGDEGVRAEGYRSQLEVYRYALEEILGIPVKKAYIWFFKTEKAVEIRF
ncbi:MAG: PD-(D/E)XK nuclease family protein, partial [Clostridia bacterium]|nr:PD-(D/E)XK nuclease family protein [Clostridia bacterium]